MMTTLQMAILRRFCGGPPIGLVALMPKVAIAMFRFADMLVQAIATWQITVPGWNRCFSMRALVGQRVIPMIVS